VKARDPETNPLSEPLKGRENGVPVEADLSAGVAPGSAFFDFIPHEFPKELMEQSPHFFFFLDFGTALILQEIKNQCKYARKGLARFLWTDTQRERAYKEPFGKETAFRGMQCHGPITDQDARVIVTIV
jgi:hypothetical protein